GFITSSVEPVIFLLIFLGATMFIVYKGVNKGIEAISKVLMPLLLVLVVGIAIFALTVTGGDAEAGRTGMEGFKIYIIPDLDGLTFKDICYTIMDAMGQLFYSVSVAMGIMITYGSYFRDRDNLVRSVNSIQFFDTLVAFLAGIMIIPVVFVFMGKEGLSNAGPGLMFVAMPKVFAQMGTIGTIIGIVFFLAVILAALTSCISILEAVVAGMMDKFGWSRKKSTLIEGIIGIVIALIVCFGYNLLYFEYQLPNGATAQILDILDYVTNNVLMPVLAIGTCLLIGWKIKPKTIIDEAVKNGERFSRKMLYTIMVKFITPIMLAFLLLSAFGII
ncbi:MAG: sodium-dependent transporter, partial [Firmicutes bacterium]|nr:sodium-dependent transporter [Bacillota bacterium]